MCVCVYIYILLRKQLLGDHEAPPPRDPCLYICVTIIPYNNNDNNNTNNNNTLMVIIIIIILIVDFVTYVLPLFHDYLHDYLQVILVYTDVLPLFHDYLHGIMITP